MQQLSRRNVVAVILSGTLSLTGHAVAAQTPETVNAQWAQYEEMRAKSIIELQPFRDEVGAKDAETGLFLNVISLNQAVGAWYVLEVRDDVDAKPLSYHIENPDPANITLSFERAPVPAFVIHNGRAEHRCRPWADGRDELNRAQRTGLPYAALCDGKLFLRNKVSGNRTNLETASEFLRDNVWAGENIVRFVKGSFFQDFEVETSEEMAMGTKGLLQKDPAPMQARTSLDERPVISTLLDIGLEDVDSGKMAVGVWYPVAGGPGIFASAFQPRQISDDVMSGPGETSRLDSVEAKATGYMIAFDLAQFDVGLAMGTDHPGLGWSPRPPASIRPKGMPGPDGVKNPAPLVPLGMVNPVIASKAAATFTAGFKRQHGAFKFGDMATFNLGHHYGFIEKGVILSKLQPNLSTLFGLTDGSVVMKTWTEVDNALLPQITFARQNGVPLLETDMATGLSVPGDRVTKWGPGNWSGSAEVKLRTLRAGACMTSSSEFNYLIYGYFSTATPSAMARTFQAYGCSYAMLLDMNALEHTYLALYVPRAGKVHVEHIVPGMALIEKKVRGGTIIPRFIGFADNRDFFYLTRKETVK